MQHSREAPDEGKYETNSNDQNKFAATKWTLFCFEHLKIRISDFKFVIANPLKLIIGRVFYAGILYFSTTHIIRGVEPKGIFPAGDQRQAGGPFSQYP